MDDSLIAMQTISRALGRSTHYNVLDAPTHTPFYSGQNLTEALLTMNFEGHAFKSSFLHFR